MSGGSRDTAQGNLVGYLVGDEGKEAGREVHVVGAMNKDGWVDDQESSSK